MCEAGSSEATHRQLTAAGAAAVVMLTFVYLPLAFLAGTLPLSVALGAVVAVGMIGGGVAVVYTDRRRLGDQAAIATVSAEDDLTPERFQAWLAEWDGLLPAWMMVEESDSRPFDQEID